MSYAKWLGAFTVSSLLVLCGGVSVQAAQGAQTTGNSMQSAQSTSNNQAMQNGGPAGSGSVSMRQGIQNNLQQAGYTDISVTPSSFFIHAKDKQGHPVAMVVGPDTFTEVTELPAGNGSSQGGSTAGSGGESSTSKP